MKTSLAQYFTCGFLCLTIIINVCVTECFSFYPETIKTLPKTTSESHLTAEYSSYLMLEQKIIVQPFFYPLAFDYIARHSDSIQNAFETNNFNQVKDIPYLIKSVEFEKINSEIDPNPGNGVENSKIGDRIFPDKESPEDNLERDKVRVKITIIPQNNASKKAPITNVAIYLRSVDMDDPSASLPPLDNEQCAQDNRGQVNGKKEGELSIPLTDFGNKTLVKTDKQKELIIYPNKEGIVYADLTVTKQPGDNFAVVASTFPILDVFNPDKDCNEKPATLKSSSNTATELSQSKLTSKITNQDRIKVAQGDSLVLEKSGRTIQVSGASKPDGIMRSKTLTIWRRLHLEIDDMGKIDNPPLTGNLKNEVVIIPGANSVDCKDLNLSNLQPLRYSGGIIIFNKTEVIEIGRNDSECRFDLNSKLKLPKSFPIGTSFEIFDDDDFNKNNSFPNGDRDEEMVFDEEIFKHLQSEDGRYDDEKKTPKNVFAQAYIMPNRAWAEKSGYNQDNLKFQLNLEYLPDKRIGKEKNFQEELDFNRNSKDKENNDFWIGYLLISYQGPRTQDCDGYTEGESHPCIGGVAVSSVVDKVLNSEQVPQGAYGCAIFLESIRDEWRTKIKEQTTGVPNIMWQIAVPHEIGHMFGIHGDNPNDSKQKIMSHSAFQAYYEFSDDHLNIIRYRIPSPGSLYKPNSN